MKIVKIKGGLGNQLFQYSFARCLQKIAKEKVKLDFSYYNNLTNDNIRKPRLLKFNINLETASIDDLDKMCYSYLYKTNSRSFLYKVKIVFEILFNSKYFFEKDRRYRPVKPLLKYGYFDGYWQSWRYVDLIIDDLKNELTPNYELSFTTQNLINEVKNQNSVFVGIRKGDYANSKSHYGEYKLNYYIKAMEYIEKTIEDPVYYIFTNDIHWVKENYYFGNRNIRYREPEAIVDDFEELLIMANCKHSIIINSTFHWWGARLNYYKGKIVVAPKIWFWDNKPIDIVPNEWVRI